MKKFMIGLSLAALATAGAAIAQHHADEEPAAMGDRTTTRAEMLQHAGKMFDRLDADKDGKIDEADRAAHKAGMFDKLDADSNGAISREEFAAADHGGPDAGHGGRKGRHGDRDGGRMGKMMLHMADANQDRVVTRDEFSAAAASHFDKVDTDKDGSISPDERKAAHEKMRAMMQARKNPQG
jgi:hypothetical protein